MPTNDFFNHDTNNIPKRGKIRSATLNSIFAAVTSGFGLFPAVADILKGLTYTATAAGTANAITATISSKITSYLDGMKVSLLVAATNSGAVTVNFNGIGAVAVKAPGGTDLSAGDFAVGNRVVIEYNSGLGYFVYNGPLFTTASAAAISAAVSGALAPLNLARVTVASHATTADIWSPAGNQVDFTGTATVTAFPAAPQAGASRTLICAAACSFTAGANLLIQGKASGETYTAEANDVVTVEAITTTQFYLRVEKYSGESLAASGISNIVTATTSVTLTSTPTLVVATPTDYGMSVTFEDATLCSLLSPIYGVDNRSIYPIVARNKAGVILGFFRPLSKAFVSLEDNGTLAGTWGITNASLSAITVRIPVSGYVPSADGDNFAGVAIDSTHDLLFIKNSSSHLYCMTVMRSTGYASSPVLVRAAAISYLASVKVADGAVLVVTNPSSSTAMEGVLISLSGDDPQVNTAATATLANTMSSIHPTLEPSGTGEYVVAYTQGLPQNEIRAITVNTGTMAVAIGSAAALQGTSSSPSSYKVVSNGDGKVMTVSTTGASDWYFKPFTVSGTTLTPGTQATASGWSTSALAFFRKWGASFLAATTDYGTNNRAHVVNLSGTVASVASNTALSYGQGFRAFCEISATKYLFGGSNGASVSFDILTLSAGSGSAGTQLNFNSPVSTTQVGVFHLESDIAYVSAHPGGTSTGGVYEINVSAASPTLNNIRTYPPASLAVPAVGYNNTDLNVENNEIVFGESGRRLLRAFSGATASFTTGYIGKNIFMYQPEISSNEAGGAGRIRGEGSTRKGYLFTYRISGSTAQVKDLFIVEAA